MNFNSIENILKDEKNKLLKLRNYVEKNFEFVGDNFSKKVREVYYDKKNKKTLFMEPQLLKKEKNLKMKV